MLVLYGPSGWMLLLLHTATLESTSDNIHSFIMLIFPLESTEDMPPLEGEDDDDDTSKMEEVD